MEKIILVTGGSGFVAARLVPRLIKSGYQVICLVHKTVPVLALESREVASALKVIYSMDDMRRVLPSDQEPVLDAVIHLAGAGIGDRLWTTHRKTILQSSRWDTISRVHRALLEQKIKCTHVLGASAIGYYGNGGDAVLSESAPQGQGFSAVLCDGIEQRIQQAAELCHASWHALRIGVVLGESGGMLSRLALPARFGLGSVMGDGSQWLSWIDREDLACAIHHVIAAKHMGQHISSGPINMTSPNPLPWQSFAESLAKVYGRKSRIKIPKILLSALGEMKHLFLDSVRAAPEVLLENNFKFKFDTVDASLQKNLQ